MILDINAYLGQWAFRRLYYNTAETLLKLMDRAGIDLAAVSSINAVTYRNAQAGNEELYEWVKRYRDRLMPIATINPHYANWEEDLCVCIEDFEMMGLKLHPSYHDYKLDEEDAAELLKVAAERKLPVFIVVRVEDERQHHWLMRVPGVSMEEIAKTIEAFPKVNFILNYIHLSEATHLMNALPKHKNFYIDVTAHYMMGSVSRGVGKIVDRIGAGRVVFGSGMPLRYPEVALNKIKTTELSDEDRERILYENAAKLLGLET